MRTLYIDCFSGLAGDMMLGALLDLSEQLGVKDQVNTTSLFEALSAIPLPPWQIEVDTCHKQGIRGLGVKITTPWGEERVEDAVLEHYDPINSSYHEHTHSESYHHDTSSSEILRIDKEDESNHAQTRARHQNHSNHEHGLSLAQIISLIDASPVPQQVKQRSQEVFDILGVAEGRAHGIAPLDVHFHEVGMVDSIVDIIGSAWCLTKLNITHIISAPPPLNRGWVKCAHGVMPLPTPATGFILEGIETIQSPHQVELITPTGAAMLRAWSHTITATWPTDPAIAMGWGAGKRDLPDRPNLLRVVLSESKQSGQQSSSSPPTICWLIEANIDDQSPEAIATAKGLLLSAGALDVWLTAIVMKEGRSAVKLSVLCVAERIAELERLLLIHSSAIGCRRTRWERTVLPRRFLKVVTSIGTCQVKVTQLPDAKTSDHWRIKVEHRDARHLARQNDLSVAEVERRVLDQAHLLLNSGQLTWEHLTHEISKS